MTAADAALAAGSLANDARDDEVLLPRPGFGRRLRADPAFWFGVVVLGIGVILAMAGPVLMPHDPNANNLMKRLAAPSGAYWFGTDDLGRDILSRVIAGARPSVLFPLGAVGLALVVGLPAGILAGYARSRLAVVLEFVADVIMSFPPLLIAVAFIAVRGPGLVNAMIVVGLIFAPRLFRIARAATREVMAETYVEAARVTGCSPFQIVRWHVLRNIAGPVVVYVSFAMGTALLIEAILSFIGLGIQPPQAAWGSMLGRAFRFLYQSPTGIVFPGLAIASTVLAFNLLGDAIRDALGRPTMRDTP